MFIPNNEVIKSIILTFDKDDKSFHEDTPIVEKIRHYKDRKDKFVEEIIGALDAKKSQNRVLIFFRNRPEYDNDVADLQDRESRNVLELLEDKLRIKYILYDLGNLIYTCNK